MNVTSNGNNLFATLDSSDHLGFWIFFRVESDVLPCHPLTVLTTLKWTGANIDEEFRRSGIGDG